MARPHLPTMLNPRRPWAVLCWSMRQQRQVRGWTGKQVADATGLSTAFISRVETGKQKPTEALVAFYEQTFEADGLLWSLWEVVEATSRAERRLPGGTTPLYRAIRGDASEFVGDTIPHGTLMKPGEVFTKTWTIRNAGTVPWQERQLVRQGPVTGPGLITSAAGVPISDAEPGETVEIRTGLKAPTYDCSSIAYFKMAHADGKLCFPDNYQLGLDLLVMVRGQMADR